MQRGFRVLVAPGAGLRAGHPDARYLEAGAELAPDNQAALAAEVVLSVEPPSLDEARTLSEGATLISFIWPARNPELIAALATRKATVLAMDRVPRTTIAQKCDALSSMGALAGQRAVLEAAAVLQRPLGAVFSAAGKLAPAKVLIIGAGVAGLAAIGTAKALGAQVRAFDTRLAAKDDVKSLGAEFLELDFKESGEGQGGYAKPMSEAFIAAEKALFARQAAEVDVVITTALVPGNKAPILWTADHVGAMRPGTVVVDLAAAQGGNCELTRADEVVRHQSAGGTVTLLGPTDLASRMAQTASELFAKNVLNLLAELVPKPAGEASTRGIIEVRSDHEIGGPMIVLLRGEAPPPKVASPTAAPPPAPSPRQSEPEPPRVAHPNVGADAAPSKPKTQYVPAHPALGKLSHPRPKRLRTVIFASLGLVLVLAWLYLRYTSGGTTPMRAEVERFVDQLAVFVLACFVGWQIIWNVTPALHTPLMSVTNAISGIILVGGLLEGGHASGLDTRSILGIFAVLLATINIAGGFWVTHRMLRMFRKQG